MTEPIRITAGRWVKFSRYECRNGCIVPARDARPRTYDPWTRRERPYKGLQGILDSSPNPLALSATQPEVVAAALGWCGRYGLFGTLFHRLISVTLAARWVRPETVGRNKPDDLAAEQTTYAQTPGGWVTLTKTFRGTKTKNATKLGEAVEDEMVRDGVLPPTATLVELPDLMTGDSVFKTQPLREAWARYFPDVGWEPNRYPYPAPASREFWQLYGEPISDIVFSAYLITNALEAIQKPNDAGAPARGFQRLSRLASQASPILEQQADGTLRQRWQTGSLLSTLALMAMEDLASGRLRRCATCQALFLSPSYQATYCSDRCRNTMQKRKFREKRPGYERLARKRRTGREED